jgi:hypothetical protein
VSQKPSTTALVLSRVGDSVTRGGWRIDRKTVFKTIPDHGWQADITDLAQFKKGILTTLVEIYQVGTTVSVVFNDVFVTQLDADRPLRFETASLE